LEERFLLLSKQGRLCVAQFQHLREDLGSLLLRELLSPGAQTCNPGTRAALKLRKLEPPAVEVPHRLLESSHLVIAKLELLPNHIIEACLESQLHFCTLTAAAASLRDEILGTTHQQGRYQETSAY